MGVCSPLAEYCDLPALNCLLFPEKASKYAVSVPSFTLSRKFFCLHTEMGGGGISYLQQVLENIASCSR